MPTGVQASLIRRTLYTLKRQYPAALDVYRVTPVSADLATGRLTRDVAKWSIRTAILLPERLARTRLLPSGMDPRFSYGAEAQVGTRVALIDRRDLPAGLVIGTQDFYVVAGALRFEVSSVTDVGGVAYTLGLKELKGAPLERIVEIALGDAVSASSTGART